MLAKVVSKTKIAVWVAWLLKEKNIGYYGSVKANDTAPSSLFVILKTLLILDLPACRPVHFLAGGVAACFRSGQNLSCIVCDEHLIRMEL